MKILFRMALIAVFAAGVLALAAPPHVQNKATPCPWPACTLTCDPTQTSPFVICKDKSGASFQTTYACCCCNEDAQHRSYRGPK